MQKHKTATETKIKEVLGEARILLPGTLMLLGFQFAAVFQQQFANMAVALKDWHLAGLCMLSTAVIMLFGIVSYHQIVDKGHNTDHLYRYANTTLILSLLFIGSGLCIDIYIVSSLITQSTQVSTIIAGAYTLFALLLWFGYTFFKRKNYHIYKTTLPV
jgi:hypothetical protein